MFTHTGVTPGACASCHNGTTATGKPATHFVTTRSCDVCHKPTGWTPVMAYRHQSPFYKQHSSSVTCKSCHYANSEVMPWKFAAYKPNCAGCHAAQFQPRVHIKVASPRILYNVIDLKDCSGSCHEYTDSTFKTIKRVRIGQHRPISGGF